MHLSLYKLLNDNFITTYLKSIAQQMKKKRHWIFSRNIFLKFNLFISQFCCPNLKSYLGKTTSDSDIHKV